MKRGAVYCRVSSQGQADHGTSLEGQRDACLQFAHEQGIAVLKVITEARTGTSLNRAGLDEIRDMAQDGQLDAVIVYDTDRLSRSFAQLWILIEEFNRRKVDLLFVRTPREESPTGKLIFGMKGLLDEHDRDAIVDRVRRGRMRRANAGRAMGTRCLPYGYTWVHTNHRSGEPGHFEIVEHEAQAVRLMFRWMAEERCTLYQIASRLNDMGIATQRGGKQWYIHTVGRILRSEAYAGTSYYNKSQIVEPRTPRKAQRSKDRSSNTPRPKEEWIRIPMPAIITPELFEATQHALERNKHMSKRNCKNDYLLRGYVFCEVCGNRMAGKSRRSSKDREARITYQCNRKERAYYSATNEGCPSVYVKAPLLEEAVWLTVLKHLTVPELAEKLLQRASCSEEQSTQRMDDALEALHRTELALQRKEDDLIEMYHRRDITIEKFSERNADIQQKMAAVREERASIQAQLDQRQVVHANREALQEVVAAAQAGLPPVRTSEERRRLFDLLEMKVYTGSDNHHAFIEGIISAAIWDLPLPRIDTPDAWEVEDAEAVLGGLLSNVSYTIEAGT